MDHSTQASQEEATQRGLGKGPATPKPWRVWGTRSMATKKGKQGMEQQSEHGVAVCLAAHTDTGHREKAEDTQLSSQLGTTSYSALLKQTPQLGSDRKPDGVALNFPG